MIVPQIRLITLTISVSHVRRGIRRMVQKRGPWNQVDRGRSKGSRRNCGLVNQGTG